MTSYAKFKAPSELSSEVSNQDRFTSSSNGSDNDEPMGKDEIESKLEKLVFGDDLGFQEALKSHKESIKSQSIGKVGNFQADDDDATKDQDQVIHDVDDADVGGRVPINLHQVRQLILSALLPRFQSVCCSYLRSCTYTRLR